MHIAMIGQKGMPAHHGGVERHVHDLSVRLVEAGHTVDAYARAWYTGGTSVDIDGVHVIHTKGINTKHLDAITHTFTATLAAIKSDAEIIHYHGVGPSLMAGLVRLFAPKKKVLVTFHSIDARQVKWGWFAKRMLRLGEWTACTMAHETIAVSRSIQSYCSDTYGKTVHYIPNAVPLMDTATTTDTIESFGLTSGEYIIALARLIPDKGMHYLISAYLTLEKQQPELLAGKKLVIVGGSYQTDSYVQYLRSMARASKNIVFTDYQTGDALAELMSHAHLFVHPSTVEGLPITVLEAMSYGLPTIVSDIKEHQEILDDQSFQFVSEDVGDLVAVLTKVLGNTRAMHRAAKKNRTTIEHAYTWETILPSIIRVYEQMLDNTTITVGRATYTKTA